MWTTLDGYRLRLPRSGSTLITAQSPGTGRRASLRRPDGGLDPHAVRFVGRVVAASRRVGALRQTGTRRCFPVFTAEVNGRHYELIAGPSVTPGELVILAIRPEVRRFSGELSDGVGHRTVQQAIYGWLTNQGLDDARTLSSAAQARGEGLRDNLGQMVGASGPVRRNNPDISYVSTLTHSNSPLRVNVEIDTRDDTRDQGSLRHEEILIRNDPGSMHVFLVVHPITGRVLRRRVYDPRVQEHRNARRAFVQNATMDLPLPRVPQRPQATLPLMTASRPPTIGPYIQPAVGTAPPPYPPPRQQRRQSQPTGAPRPARRTAWRRPPWRRRPGSRESEILQESRPYNFG